MLKTMSAAVKKELRSKMDACVCFQEYFCVCMPCATGHCHQLRFFFFFFFYFTVLFMNRMTWYKSMYRKEIQ